MNPSSLDANSNFDDVGMLPGCPRRHTIRLQDTQQSSLDGVKRSDSPADLDVQSDKRSASAPIAAGSLDAGEGRIGMAWYLVFREVVRLERKVRSFECLVGSRLVTAQEVVASSHQPRTGARNSTTRHPAPKRKDNEKFHGRHMRSCSLFLRHTSQCDLLEVIVEQASPQAHSNA